MRPYEHDLAFLHEELEHHEYITRKFQQEQNTTYAKEFEAMCKEIRDCIAVTENKQAAAIFRMVSTHPVRTESTSLTDLQCC